MQTQKMSLANIKGKLSRAEMKKIMAGSGDGGCSTHGCSGDCKTSAGYDGTCGSNSNGCYCSAVH